MGKLIIVPTPIGNLQDMTFRAVDALRSCDVILAEDTRTTGKLLKHFDINTQMRAYHMHNEHKKVDELTGFLETDVTACLVSDAGTPGISDPGFLLARACIEKSIEVICLPGPTAFVPALIASGLPCDKFVFEGFLPHKKGRQTRLKLLADEERTLVFYESPHRLLKTLVQLAEFLGEERNACVSREISKLYEQHVRGDLGELIKHFTDTPPKGEIVLIVAGK